MTSAEARERVARGATLLDEQRPGWAAKININKLRMEDCDFCALGQLFGFYGDGVRAFGWSCIYGDVIPVDTPQVVHGFTLDGNDVDSDDKRWKMLRAAWIDAIHERRTPPVTWTHRALQAVGLEDSRTWTASSVGEARVPRVATE